MEEIRKNSFIFEEYFNCDGKICIWLKKTGLLDNLHERLREPDWGSARHQQRFPRAIGQKNALSEGLWFKMSRFKVQFENFGVWQSHIGQTNNVLGKVGKTVVHLDLRAAGVVALEDVK